MRLGESTLRHGYSTRDWMGMSTGASGSRPECNRVLSCEASSRLRQCLRENDYIQIFHLHCLPAPSRFLSKWVKLGNELKRLFAFLRTNSATVIFVWVCIDSGPSVEESRPGFVIILPAINGFAQITKTRIHVGSLPNYQL